MKSRSDALPGRPRPFGGTTFGQVGARILALALSIVFLLPLYWMINGSFQVTTNTIRLPPPWLPIDATISNYARLLSTTQAPRWFLNSLFVSTAATVAAVVTSTTAGYVFSRKPFPGSRWLFWLVIVSMALPGSVTLVPLYIIMRDLGWIDSYMGIIAPLVAYPFGAFLVRQYMQVIPKDLFDAATVDGASEWSVFRLVVLPLAKPVIGAVAIFSFIGAWGDYLWQLVIVNSPELNTFPVGLATVIHGYERVDLGLAMAGATVAFLPMLLIFLLFQDYFTKGIVGGAVKG